MTLVLYSLSAIEREQAIRMMRALAKVVGRPRLLQALPGLAVVNVRKMQVGRKRIYEGWNFNSGNYLFTTDTK